MWHYIVWSNISFDKLVNFYQTARRYNPENSNIYNLTLPFVQIPDLVCVLRVGHIFKEGFDVLTVVIMKNSLFCDITPCIV
jgi:hypothetical protein